jgi:hypothetical protein
MIIGINGYSGSGKDTIGTIIQYLNCNNPDTPLEEVLKDPLHNQWWLEDSSGWEVKKWAGKLKYIASLLTGIPQEKFEDQEFKKTELGPEWDRQFYTEGKGWQKRPMLIREFLQILGTEGLRLGLHENTWVNALMTDYKSTWNDPDPIPQNDYTITYRENYGYTSLIHYGGGSEAEVFNHEIIDPNWIITDTRFPNEAQAIKDAGGIVIRVDRPGVSAINAHPSETALDNWDFDYKIWNGSDLVALSFTIENILKKVSHA